MAVPIARLYILKIFAKFLGLSLFVFCSLLVMLNFVGIINQGVLAGFSFYFLAKSLLYLLPNIVGMALPLAFLLAILLSLGQLSQDGEILALRAGGFSFFEIFSFVFYSSLLASLLLVWVNNWLGPEAFKRSTDYTISMLNRVTKIELKPRTFQQISEWTLYADKVNALSGEMRGVKLLRRVDKGGDTAFVNKINAATGRYGKVGESGLEIALSDGQLSQTDCKDPEKILYGRFASYKTLLPFFSASAAARKLNQREISTPGLLARLRAGIPDPQVEAKYRIEAASRFALALAPLIFFLVGAPLGVALDKRGRSAGFGLSLLIIFFYYGLTISGMVLSRKYPGLFPWVIFAPALLTGAAGLALWRRKLYAK
ncbi:MAG: LptF/LptG family permease [Elusimicrobiales bacterium]|nr:LptF/LptG family permease [Elusimicrobiales bacterium]